MTQITAEPASWSTSQKIVFRFFLLFFPLYIFLNSNGVVPYTNALNTIYIQPFHKLIPWMAKDILGMVKPITVFTGDSADTTYDYVVMLFIIVLSAAGTLIWSVVAKNTSNYNKLLYWLTVVVRYFIAITMVAYASYKIIKLQFPALSLGHLLEPVGNMSPFGLAWAYFGYSTGFNYFLGFGELICGLLFFSRKTTTLAAIVGVIVAGNIMAVNYFFDIPVKILATMLVVMCGFLLAKDAHRLVNFFFRNREALPSNLPPVRFKARWKNIALVAIKYVLIAEVILGNFIPNMQLNEQVGDNAKKPPLYGIYNVESFVSNKDTIAPLTTDTSRWSKLIISHAGGAEVKLMTDSMKNYSFKPDTIKHTLVMNTEADTLHKLTFTYALQKSGILALKGKWKQDSLHIRLRQYDIKNFTLLNRGFHFVNETMFFK